MNIWRHSSANNNGTGSFPNRVVLKGEGYQEVFFLLVFAKG